MRRFPQRLRTVRKLALPYLLFLLLGSLSLLRTQQEEAETPEVELPGSEPETVVPEVPPVTPVAPEAPPEETGETGETEAVTSFWYRSNPLGMRIAEFPETPNLGNYDWVLEWQNTEQTRNKRLYYRGNLQEEWLLTYRQGLPFQEIHNTGGTILERIFYDLESGLISEIASYQPDGETVKQRELFFYEGRNLAKSSLYNASDSLAQERFFRIADNGNLLKLQIINYQDDTRTLEYQLPEVNTMIQAGENKKYLISIFNSIGLNTAQVTYNNDTVSKRISFTYDGQNRLLRSIEIQGDTITEYNYNGASLVTQSQTWKNNILNHAVVNQYDTMNRVLVTVDTNWVENIINRSEYTYVGNTEDIATITFYQNDQIEKVRIYEGVTQYFEEIYLDEAPAARVYFTYGTEVGHDIIAPLPESGLNLPENTNSTGTF